MPKSGGYLGFGLGDVLKPKGRARGLQSVRHLVLFRNKRTHQSKLEHTHSYPETNAPSPNRTLFYCPI